MSVEIKSGVTTWFAPQCRVSLLTIERLEGRLAYRLVAKFAPESFLSRSAVKPF